MHFLTSLLLGAGIGLGAIGMLAMVVGAVCVSHLDTPDEDPLPSDRPC